MPLFFFIFSLDFNLSVGLHWWYQNISNMFQNGHNTLSYLRMVPQYTDNKANLICQAYNPAMLHELILNLKLWSNQTTMSESSSLSSVQMESSANRPNFSSTISSSSSLPSISLSSSSSEKTSSSG